MDNNLEQIFYGEDARTKLSTGIGKAVKAVASTYGAKGRNVSILYKGQLTSTKDGVTVARHIFVPDRAEMMGVMMVKEAAGKTVDLAGDGTTQTSVLLNAFVELGTPLVSKGSNPVALTREIGKAVEEAVEALKTISTPINSIEELKNIAAISANNDSIIGDVVAEVVWKVGKDGVVMVEEGKDSKTTIRMAEGIRFASGLVEPSFINNPDKNRCDLGKSVVVLSERPVVKAEELIPAADFANMNGLGLVVIAPDIEQSALGFLVVNAAQGKLKCAAVKSPGVGEYTNEMMDDIAIMVGGQFIKQSASQKIETTNPNNYGIIESFEANMLFTTLKEGRGVKAKINERVTQLKSQLKDETNEERASMLKERIASLQNGIGVITVGGATPTEIKEKAFRFEDSVRASLSALEEGYVDGGGVGYLKMAESTTLDTEGAKLLSLVLKKPIEQLLFNCGVDSEIKKGKGYNALSDEWVDMKAAGIIDPAKVLRVSLQNAASAATVYLTTETLIVL
jgi:chaperonin GroEL